MKDGVFIPTTVINAVLKFAEKDKGSIRYPLQGLWIDVTDKKHPIIEATDGHRMHRVQPDNTVILSPDTYNLTKTELDKKSQPLIISKHEVKNIMFKIKEIQAIAKIHGGKGFPFNPFKNLTIKFSIKHIYFYAHDKVLTRYIRLDNGIPAHLVNKEIAIDINYFLQVLDIFKGKATRILISDIFSPIIFMPVDNEYPLHLVMPVRLDSKQR